MRQEPKTSDKGESTEKSKVAPPSITLPKGGGAIRGIGEKFSANPVTGTGGMTVPIATSSGRSGFGPQLSLSYDSGAGNGPFGLGWNLSLPAITRKTDKGLPRYQDLEESDVFILSGAEDLVPVLIQTGTEWKPEALDPRTVNGKSYQIRRYRPRIEGLFARIERWTNLTDSKDVFWRSISKDNITTWYGKTENSRIADADPDPAHPPRILSWLICETSDDKGNAVIYTYKEEDGTGVDLVQAHERNRGDRQDPLRMANRYLKRISYGNRVSLLDNAGHRPPFLTQVQLGVTEWMFEVVFDYGDHDPAVPKPNDDQVKDATGALKYPWKLRQDPFSSYRAGFEVRTYRLCRRILMFHHFEQELGTPDYLVRATHFDYSQSAIASFLTGVTQSGYKRNKDRTYRKKSLPPVELTYSQAVIQEEVHEVDPASLENLPQGLDNSRYQWADLDGEGLSGLLTEQGGAWFYKRNQSALPVRDLAGKENTVARFAPLECVATMPSSANLSGGQQLLDLAGDGHLHVVDFEGPNPGFFERTTDEGWETHRSFTSLPNIAWRDPNLKFIDLTGDGHADILITEDQAFSWYPSLAEAGFGPAEHVRQAIDEERGPRLIFADGTQSIYLADMSGDGLTDLVRIRNGEVSYWPNLGYGRFGNKVTMDHAPWFDAPDMFDQRRIRLADIDGSGAVDILYLTANGVHIYFNHSGNGWSERRIVSTFPRIDNLSAVSTIDLLGNGTACLVWSSPLPGDARSPIRYIDLMGGQKPHLLLKTINNLGAETEVTYAPSTKFYLMDKQAGQPWSTKLPFPVHCVEKVTVRDTWRQTAFSTTYSYHHGYFDGVEREFRGFGRVEQQDVETYGKFMQGNGASPYITDDHELYQPPIKTITWYHTGAAFERNRILSALKHEYVSIPGFTEHQLPEPTLTPADLSPVEWREALRACKGMVLRQEVFELDVDALAQGKEIPVRLFTTAYHNSNITRVQPQGMNRYAVFLLTESEAIMYSYELDLRPPMPMPDPRIAHTLNLRFDEYGRAVQSVVVGYPRLVPYKDSTNTLNQEQLGLIQKVQDERHLAYTETHFTDELPIDSDQHRLPAPCEVLTYELTGADNDHGFVPGNGRFYSLDDFRVFELSDSLQGQGTKPVTKLAYQQQPADETAHKRIVEWMRMLYVKDDLSGPEPFGTNAWLGLPYETYKHALTKDLLSAVFDQKLTNDVRAKLDTATISGYTQGTTLDASLVDQYWIRSGIAGFEDDAAAHFYLPERYIDPFGNVTTLAYDGKYDLFIQSSTDALGNATRVHQFDYRVLAPAEMEDINGNRTEVYFDILGMVVASAMKGKGTEADDLIGFNDDLANPPATEVQTFCTDNEMDVQQARDWLKNATARFVYHYGEARDASGKVTGWATRPAGACGIVRERHANRVALDPEHENPLQVALECSDGSGNVLMKKVQAEPEQQGEPLRWIINGLTILNNKGKPVKQYEPAFSDRFGCEMPQANGITPVMYYDAAGRVVRTNMPDGTFSRVEFSPWHVKTFDANDTVLESRWYQDRGTPDPKTTLAADASPETRAAWLAAHHANTPAQVHLDSLGREVIAIGHNRLKDKAGKWRDEKYLTYTKLDAEGKPLWIRDARGNLVMQYITPAKANNDPSNAIPANAVPCYDIAGNLLFQHSMDAGDRWMLMDAAGKPMYAWDRNEQQVGANLVSEDRIFLTNYDALHRPVEQWLSTNGASKMIERFEYQDANQNDMANLNGQLIRHYDPSGLIETVKRDFKGNVLEVARRLNSKPTDAAIDWQGNNPDAMLEAETFRQLTTYDALNRMTELHNWHRDTPGKPVSRYEPSYNERGVLVSERLTIRLEKEAAGIRPAPITKTTVAIKKIVYNEKGQKTYLALGNGTLTQYDYDPKTFRVRQIRTTRSADSSDFPSRRSNLANPAIVQQLLYTYDAVGNITEIEDHAYKPVFFDNGIAEPKSRYEYDALYRLISATGRETAQGGDAALNGGEPASGSGFPITDQTLRTYVQIYNYDEVGDFVSMQHTLPRNTAARWTRHYATHPDSNRLWRTWYGAPDWDHAAQTQRTEYGYDIHGNMLNVANVAKDHHLQWDYRDMITSINLGGGGTAFYQYDSGNQRTRKRIVKEFGTPGYWERIYLGGYELYRLYNGNGSNPVEEIESHHLFEGEERVLLVDDVIKAGGATHSRTDGLSVKAQMLFRYQYSNHLGSSCLELNEDADIISYEEYHPYGTSAYRAINRAIEAPPKRYRYTGMERDEESGLSYHTARYYLPWLGRWVSCDSDRVASEVTNKYSAMRNSPAMLVDLNGKAAIVPPRVRIPTTGLPPTSSPQSHHSIPSMRQKPVDTQVPGPDDLPLPLPIYVVLKGLLLWFEFNFRWLEEGKKRHEKTANDLRTGAQTRIQDRDAPGAPSSGPLSAPAPMESKDVIGDFPSASNETRKAPGDMPPHQVEFPPSEISGDLKVASKRVADLERIRGRLEGLAQDVIGISKAEKVPETQGRLGTRAHAHLEYMIGQFNKELEKKGSKFRLRAEVFFDSKGNEVPRRALGSLGVDVLITWDDLPIEALDLKAGRGWSKEKADEIERRVGAPLFQMGPQVDVYSGP